MADLKRARQDHLKRAYVKEAFDTLPAAVCYFTPSGMVKLCNLQMHRLYREMTQRDLQTLPELRAAMAACGENSAVRLSVDSSVYLFPDGSAWQYAENTVATADGRAYTEAIFSDVTELYERKRELEEQTKELREIARELKKLSDNVLAMTREKEILSFKTRLHDQMGAGLVAVRQTLLQTRSPADSDAAIALWRRAVRFTQYDNERPEERGDCAEFIHDAASIGVEVKLDGPLPQSRGTLDVFLIAMRECFTNCVRHAGATEMYVSLSEGGGEASISITNNGKAPRAEVVPGGGLNDLRRHVRGCGGTMEIRSLPSFMLTVRIPIQKEELP